MKDAIISIQDEAKKHHSGIPRLDFLREVRGANEEVSDAV